MSHQLKIELLDSNPKIYRTVVVPEVFSFEQLHEVIQLVMNWENTHLYEFFLGAFYRSDAIVATEYFEEQDFFRSRFEKYDASNIYLSDILSIGIKSFHYLYDHGDDWRHLVKVMAKPKYEVEFPVCIKGENDAPVEDCGGISGFYNLLEILDSPKNTTEKKEYRQWLDLRGRATYHDVYGFKMDFINEALEENFEEL